MKLLVSYSAFHVLKGLTRVRVLTSGRRSVLVEIPFEDGEVVVSLLREEGFRVAVNPDGYPEEGI